MEETRFEQLKRVLDEVFMFDRADLDFGLYRIMNVRREEVQRFLDQDLRMNVRAVLAELDDGVRSEIETEMERLEAQLRNAGVEPSLSSKFRDLQERYDASADAMASEAEVYGHLAAFFRRYYQSGDFIALRRYKEGVYALPYGGEEVKLYWANADQHYVKSSEQFRDYTFLLSSDLSEVEQRVHFKLVDADTEQNNNRVTSSGERRFVLCDDSPVVEQDDGHYRELIIRFEYRIDPDRSKQKDLNAAAVERILEDPTARDWVSALCARPGESAYSTILAKHISAYTAKNMFDYFIHRDLGAFLRRELDYYLKTEVTQLDDIDTHSVTGVSIADTLRRIRAIRLIANRIIDFLAQLEDFQLRLWLKKKFVIESQYCMTIDRVPNELYPDILANDRQLDEWIQLFKIDELKGYSEPIDVQFLLDNPHLVVDTSFFTDDFKYELLGGLSDIDASTDGVLIHGDNFQALSLLNARYAAEVQCIYNDPPFNTDNDDFAYKDGFKRSSWLAMMDGRLSAAVSLMADDATLYAHIDYGEKERLRLLLDEHLTYITEIIWRIGWISGYKSAAEKWIRNHDTIYQYGRSASPYFAKQYIPYPDDYVRRDGKRPTGKGIPIEDTWNASKDDPLHSIQILSFSEEKVGDRTLTQKNENLLERMITASSRSGDIVLDYFLGSGTTTAAAQKLGRHWIGIESGSQFDDYALPRMKRVLWGEPYGISKSSGWKGGGQFKVIRIESYEDTLNNLELRRTDAQQEVLNLYHDLRDDYMLRYWIDVETRDSSSLLNAELFSNPWTYTLNVGRGSTAETRSTQIDLVETFNWLVGIRVDRIVREDGVLLVTGRLPPSPGVPSGENAIVIWRDADVFDAEALGDWFKELRCSSPDLSFDVVYVNGSNELVNAQDVDETWQVRLIEEEFERLMFSVTEGELRS